MVVTSYCRAWALSHCLESLARQTRPPDEVVVILKDCGDGSGAIVRKFERSLPIKLILQNSGGSACDAYELGYRNSSGDVVLFIDDDAVAEERWVEKYEWFFSSYPEAGAAGSLVFKAYLSEDRNSVVKTGELFYTKAATHASLHRKPLEGFEEYCDWISKAGFMGSRGMCNGIHLSIDISGVNMGFRAQLIKDFPLTQFYGSSRKCFWFEKLLAYYAMTKGFKTYLLNDVKKAPIVWHIVHGKSLTRGRGFWHEYWTHFDRVTMYWRLRKLGAPVSSLRYVLGLLVLLRRRTLPRFLATLHGLVAMS
ncbi:MAG: glycosyltransferase [Sulfolobales archaeon]|nr:glycosyltransferase [Sulfolobales archaeon]